MDRELQTYYEDQFSMFVTPGWADFMEDIKKVLVPLEEIMTVPDLQTLNRRQGQIDILRWVLNRKEMMNSAWRDLTDGGDSA